MSNHLPTPEQTVILDTVRSTEENLLISALAGAAKTTTLVMVAEQLPKKQLLCLAFNKSIAEEMQERFPGNCEARTLNSLGHRAWSTTLGKGLRVETDKNFKIIKQIVDTLPRRDKTAAYDNFSFILKAVEFGKVMGYVPTGKFENARPVMNDDALFESLEEEPTPLLWDIIREASFVSLKQSWSGVIDYSDQILLPGVFPVSVPSTQDVVLLDETQDLSVLNHVLIKKLVRSKRLIAVGDDCQSIYAFRGAHPGSMSLLKSDFDMQELRLSVSFRCPEEIVREAQWRAPHMQWHKSGGAVENWDAWDVSDIPDQTTILCRNNAPIFAMAFKLLKAGRYPRVVGNDVGKSLIKTLKKLGPVTMSRDALETAIDQWQTIKLTKTRNEAAVRDQASCLRIFAEQGETLADAIAYADHILEVKGPVTLLTIHKAKGLEFDHVIILDRHLIRTGPKVQKHDQQEDNLLYVAQTRSKNVLCYANSEDWT